MKNLLQPGVLEAFIGACSVVAVALIGYFTEMRKRKAERQQRVQAELELTLQSVQLELSDFIKEWGEISIELANLMNETELDRFLILRAWNGHLYPKWTTAIYQMREGDQKPFSYVHYELDSDYQTRLATIQNNGPLIFKTEKLPPSGIRDIYRAEGVKDSLWCHISTKTLKNRGNAKAVTYCSFSTHQESGLDSTTILRCKVLTGRLQGLALSFGED